MATLASQWMEQGFQRGEARGIKLGEQRGKLAWLFRLLENRFPGELSDAQRRQIEEASEAQLEDWFLRLHDANTLDAVLQTES